MDGITPMVYFDLHWSERLRVAPVVVLSEEQEAELTRLVRSKRTSVRLWQRARIVLLAAQGMMNKDIAEQLGVGRVQVSRWRERYVELGLPGIERDLPRGAPPVKVDVQQLVELTTPEQAASGHALEHAQDGRRVGRQCQHGDAPLAGQWPEAAPRARLQGLA